MRHFVRLLAALAVFGLATSWGTTRGFAQDNQDHHQSRPDRSSHGGQNAVGGILGMLPADSVTEHTVATKSGSLRYTATAGTFTLYAQSGEASAKIFYTAYVAHDDKAAGDTEQKSAGTRRPVTFVFNGGPGASSAFLHLGLVGPRIVRFGKDNHDGANATLIDNPDTWLAFTDLVIVDPVGAGWSRAAKPDDASHFWSVNTDAETMAKVVALYVGRNGRAASPKYLLGESYGGFRAAKVASALQEDQGIVVSGIVMLSPMLEGAFQFGGDRFALGAALDLPSLAAAEMERRNNFDANELRNIEHFALNDYLTTLAGPPPQGDAARSFYKHVAQITGIDEDAVARSHGFLRDLRQKNLRSAGGLVASQYDASFLTDDPFPESRGHHGDDPQLDGYIRAYGGMFVGYARDELGYNTDITYNLLSTDVNRKWQWRSGGRGQPSVSDDLRKLLAFNPTFRLAVAHGYSDLVTPYMVSRYVLDHLPDMGETKRAKLYLYRGGHMIYLVDDSRRAFTSDVSQFYAAAP